MSIKKILAKNYVNFRGWSSKRKIVVIESDDWGSVRMPSLEVYNTLIKNNIPADKSYFTKYDCLESKEDLELLFGLLSSYKDKNGNNPVITANAVVANPDFKKIAQSGKSQYIFEPITDTYSNYPDGIATFNLWKNEGIANHLLWPQFHGREHINVKKWMKAIQSDSKQENLAFDNEVILGIGSSDLSDRQFKYMAAFEYADNNEQADIEKITAEGLRLFHDIFGFESQTFVASGSVRGDHLDDVLSSQGVKYHQCGQQLVPSKDGKYKMINRYWGAKNSQGQMYWRRNATFEPSRNLNFDFAESCLKEIEIAFRWGKPATINSHRVNYSGGISVKNRDNSLKLLDKLIREILKKWPDAEFMSSDQLGAFMRSTN